MSSIYDIWVSTVYFDIKTGEIKNNMCREEISKFLEKYSRQYEKIIVKEDTPLYLYYLDKNGDHLVSIFTELTNGCAYLICSNSMDDMDFLHELRIFMADLFKYSAILVTDTNPGKIDYYKAKGYELLDERENQRTTNHIKLFLFEI